MKKFFYFFTLVLLAIWGTADVKAQVYEVSEEPVSSITPGQQVVLQPNRGSYMCGGEVSATVNDNCLYEFVSAGNEVDGQPTYWLKQVSKNRYLKDYPTLNDWLDSSDVAPEGAEGCVSFTSTTSDAFEFTVMPAVKGSDNPREATSVENCEGGFVLTRVALGVNSADGATYPYYLGGLPALFISPWDDTNVWFVYTVAEVKGKDLLEKYLIENAMTLDKNNFVVGTNPGEFDEAFLNAYVEVYDRAMGVVNGTATATEEECEQLVADLQAALEALNKSVRPVVAGYYYIVTPAKDGDPTYMFQDGENLRGDRNWEQPEVPTEEATSHIWKVIAAENDKFYLQNFGSAKYTGGVSTSAVIKMIDAAEHTVAFPYYGNGYFNISGESLYHCDGSYNIVGWNDATATANHYKFVSISEELLAEIGKSQEQARLTEALNTLAANAEASYEKGRSYSADDMTNDSYWDGGHGLIADASQIYNANATCNPEHEAGNAIANLVDGNNTTYYHTEWYGGEAPAEAHYIDIDLGKDVQAFALKYTERKGQHSNGAPKNVTIFAADAAEGPWTAEVTKDLLYQYPTVWADAAEGDAPLAASTGVTVFELSKAYRYIRFQVNTTIRNNKVNGYPFWYYGEMGVFENPQYDPSQSEAFEEVPPVVRAALAALIASAKEKVAANNATQEDIDALQAAYDEFLAAYPDPVKLTNAIAAAKKICNIDLVGEGLGTYPEDAYNTFNAVIVSVEGTVADVMKLKQINDGIAALEAATAVYNATLVLPEAGKVYYLQARGANACNSGKDARIFLSSGKGWYDENGDTKVCFNMSGANASSVNASEESLGLNYLWYVVSCDGQNGILLRNLGTGYYLQSQSGKNANVVGTPAVAPAFAIGSAGYAGYFNIKCSDATSLCARGGGDIVSNPTAVGDSLQAIGFVETVIPQYGGMSVPASKGKMQIMTLPFSYYTPAAGEVCYEVVGRNSENIVLKEINADDVVEAGTPLVVLMASGDDAPASYNITVDWQNDVITYEDFVYAAEGKNVNGLVGVIAPVTTSRGSYLANGNLAAVSENQVINTYSGYFLEIPETTEDGDAVIAIPTGIENAVVIPANQMLNVYTISGIRVRTNVEGANALKNLPSGLYIVGGKKVFVK